MIAEAPKVNPHADPPLTVQRSGRRGWRVLLVEPLYAVGVAVLVAGLVGSSPTVAAQQGPVQNSLAGARVFGSKGCVRCHSIDGLGGKEGPDLGSDPRIRTVHSMAAALWNHLPRMVRRMRELQMEPMRLNAREAGDLVAFLSSVHYFHESGDVEAGKKIFSEKSCIVCHQIRGVGGVVGPNLDFLPLFHTPIQVATTMWNHGPSMSDVMRERGIERPRFNEAELTDLIAYLESASEVSSERPLYVLPGRADRGRQTFDDKGCATCHRVRGRGGIVGLDLGQGGQARTALQLAALMWNKVPAMSRAMAALRLEVPQLREDEMADIIAYLYSVRYFAESGDPRRGRRRLSEKGCLGCHSLNGRGAQIAGDLGQARSLGSQADVFAALWNHATIEVARDQRGTVSWPELRAADMADMTAYFQSLEQNR